MLRLGNRAIHGPITHHNAREKEEKRVGGERRIAGMDGWRGWGDGGMMGSSWSEEDWEEEEGERRSCRVERGKDEREGSIMQ